MQRDTNFCIRRKRQAGDPMAEKKERERFSIKFNEKDKNHRLVIELLEEQPPRSKAQFIVNAVLHYINCTETPNMSLAQPVNRDEIKAIVLEILNQQETANKKEDITDKSISQKAITSHDMAKTRTAEIKSPDSTMDNATLSLIADTLSAFRGN